jgi:cystathionine beta-lyase/cystathionine gamma-synthase
MEHSEELVLSKCDKYYNYNRTSGPELDKLTDILSKNYNAKSCLVTSSGMHAIGNLLQGLLIYHNFDKFNIIYSSELFSCTPDLFTYYKDIYNNLTLEEFNIMASHDTLEIFETKYKSQNNILYIESCSNPNGYIFDFSLIPKLRSLSNILYVIVDNTWLTEIIFNPMKYNADFVVVSLTKYYSGGTAIAGAIVSNHENIMNCIINWARINGHHVSPHHCNLICEHLSNIQQRIINSSTLTMKVMNFMLTHPKIYNVSHPLINNHKSNHLAKKYFEIINDNQLGPSVLTFMVRAKKNRVMKIFTRHNDIIDFKTSFGSKVSRLDTFPGQYEYHDENEIIEYTVCRLAVGYGDDYERIIKGLDELINKL